MSANYDEAARLLEAIQTIEPGTPVASVEVLHSRAIGYGLLALHDRLDQFFTEVVAVLGEAKKPEPGICGAAGPELLGVVPRCTLKAGHAGWHCDDSDTAWSNEV